MCMSSAFLPIDSLVAVHISGVVEDRQCVIAIHLSTTTLKREWRGTCADDKAYFVDENRFLP